MLGVADYFQIDHTAYIVTNFQAGGDLLSYMQALGKAFLSEELVLHIFAQIAFGLKGIHLQGIVHRDLKHKNIFLSSLGKHPKVKIADFGLAYQL